MNDLVSICVLSFNRKEELKNTLVNIYNQNYRNIEVLVVDNASSDGSPQMVEKEFPGINLIKLKKNVGIAGWNEGYKAANGEYVLVLDDDAYPAKDSLTKAVENFILDEDIACVAFNLIDTNTGSYYKGNWLPRDKTKKTYWPIFVGCAFMVNSDRLPKSFEFPGDYFIYQHELPMAAEIYLSGKEISFVPEIVAYHNFKSDKGYSIIGDSYAFKNKLLYISKYLYLPLVFFYFFQCITFYLTRSLRHKWFKEYIRILVEHNICISRKPVPFKYFLSLRPLHLFNFSLLSKIIK